MAEAEPENAVGRSAGLVEITNAIVGLHKEFYGRGPIKARCTLDRDLVVVVLEGGFTQAERTLSESGRSSAVEEARQNMQDVIKDHWIGTVERLLARKVRCFVSASDPTHEVQVETFLLEPTASSGA